MKKIYFLSTCSTCSRIISGLPISADFELQDIKTEPITAQQIDEMFALAGSYEALFSRRSLKYKSMGLSQKVLSESDFRMLILQEYTFLKRPVFLIDNDIFIGNDKKTIALVAEKIAELHQP